MYTIISCITDLILAYFLSDFLVGMFHWIKDSYFTPFTPFIGKYFIWNSRLHHIKPQHITNFDDITIMHNSAKWTFLWLGPLIFINGISLFKTLLFLFISANDIIHKYAHMNETEIPRLIYFLQKYGIIQNYTQHHRHHIPPYNVDYCPITPHLNPVFEYFDFWRKLELIIYNICGYHARDVTDIYIESVENDGGILFVKYD